MGVHPKKKKKKKGTEMGFQAFIFSFWGWLARTYAKHVCHPLDDHKKFPCRSLCILEIFTPT